MAIQPAPETWGEQQPHVMAQTGEVVDFPHQSNGDFFTQYHASIKVPGSCEAVPLTINIPRNGPSSPLLHLVVPGLGGIRQAYERPSAALARYGNLTTAYYDPSRFDTDPIHPQRLHANTVAAVLEHVANSEKLRALPGANQIDRNQFVAIGHSMGNYAAVVHANRHPGELAVVSMFQPVGVEYPHLFRFGRRLERSGKREIVPALLRGMSGGNLPELGAFALAEARYLLANPVRTGAEAISCLRADLAGRILQARADGTKIALFTGDRDELIPEETTLARAMALGLADYIRALKNMDHLGPQKQPVRFAHEVADATHHLLNSHAAPLEPKLSVS